MGPANSPPTRLAPVSSGEGPADPSFGSGEKAAEENEPSESPNAAEYAARAALFLPLVE